MPITIGEEQFVELDRFHLNHVPHRDEWNLLIKNVQPFDAGVYECQISSKQKTMRRNITLYVIGKFGESTFIFGDIGCDFRFLFTFSMNIL